MPTIKVMARIETSFLLIRIKTKRYLDYLIHLNLYLFFQKCPLLLIMLLGKVIGNQKGQLKGLLLI